MKRIILTLLSLVLLLSACGNDDEIVTLSAAASTRDAIEKVVVLFNEAYPDFEVDMNFGGSGALKIQIEQGAPVDIFLSANVNHYEDLVNDGYITEGITYLGNRLVLITPQDNTNIMSIEDLKHVDRLALGTPESVPAGEYGYSALVEYELWETVRPNVVYAEDVRQVLQYVELGEVDAGIVYHTDALTSDAVDIIATFDSTSHESIEYPLGILESGAGKEAVIHFYEFLQSEKAREVFKAYGFTTE